MFYFLFLPLDLPAVEFALETDEEGLQHRDLHFTSLVGRISASGV